MLAVAIGCAQFTLQEMREHKQHVAELKDNKTSQERKDEILKEQLELMRQDMGVKGYISEVIL